MFTLKANDGLCIPISREAAALADFLNTQCDLVQGDEPLEIWEADGHLAQKLVDFLEMAKEKPTIHINRPLKNHGDLGASGVEKWALDYLEGFFTGQTTEAAWDTIFRLLNIADFVNCEPLIKLLTAKVASRVAAMDQVTRESVFRPSRPLTQEEMEKIREEQAWAMEDPVGED